MMMNEADYRGAMGGGGDHQSSSFTSKINIHKTKIPFETLKKKVVKTEHVSTRTLRPVFGHRKKVSRSIVVAVEEEQESSVATATIMTVALPEYARTLHEICRQCIARRRLILNVVYNAQIVLWTATTIVATVLYGHYYEGFPQVEMILDDTSRLFGRTILVEDWWQLGAFCATVLLPLYITFLIASRDSFVKQPFSLPRAMAALETEIFLFRTKTGIYKDLDTCRQSLATRLEELWNDSIRVEVAQGIIWTTKEEDEDDGNEENEEKRNNRKGIWTRACASVTGLLGSTEQSDSGGDKKGHVSNEAKTTSKDGSTLNQRQLEQKSKKNATLPNIPTEPLETDSLLIAELPSVSFDIYRNDSSDPEAQTRSSPSKSKSSPFACSNGYSAVKTEQDRDIAKGASLDRGAEDSDAQAIGDHLDTKECKEEIPDNDFIDDGYSDLSPEQYMNARIQKIRAEKEAKVKFWQLSQDCFEQGIQILTLGASVTALVSMQWTIPIILAVSAVLTSVLEIGDFRKSILSTNQELKQLDELQEGYKTKRTGQKEVEVGNDDGGGNGDDTLLTLPNEQAWESLVETAEAIILKGEH